MPERTLEVFLDPAGLAETIRVLGLWQGRGLILKVESGDQLYDLWQRGWSVPKTILLPGPDGAARPPGLIGYGPQAKYSPFWAPLPICNDRAVLAFRRGPGNEILGLVNGVPWLVLADGETDWGRITPHVTALWVFRVRRIGEVSALASVSCAHLSFCGDLRDVTPLAGLTDLSRLDLSWCMGLTDVRPLAGLTDLASLNLSGCEALADLTPLAGLTKLTCLDLRGC